MAALAFRAAAAATDLSGTATSITVTKPTGAVEGDLLVANILNAAAGGDGTAQALTPPSGWTLFRQFDTQTNGGAFNTQSTYYYKIAGASEPADYTWSCVASHYWEAGIVCYNNPQIGDPLGNFTDGFTAVSTSAVLSATTTDYDNDLVLAFAINDNTTSTWTAPSGMTSRLPANQLAIFEVIQPTAGTTGSKTATSTNAGVNLWLLATFHSEAVVVAAPGAVVLAGTDATLTPALFTHYTLTADPGAVTLTGTDATLSSTVITHRTLTADPGAVVLAGTVAILKYGYDLVAAAGALVLTGTAASLLVGYLVTASPGTVALTGTAATFVAPGALTFRSASSGTPTTAAFSITITKPAGTLEGDLLIAAIYNDRASSSYAWVDTPAGWHQIFLLAYPNAGGGRFRASYYWKIAGASEAANYTWSTGESYNWKGTILAYSNPNEDDPWGDYAQDDFIGSVSAIVPSMTAVQNNSLILAIVADETNTPTWTEPAGMTQRVDANGIGVFELAQSSAGSTSARTATVSTSGRGTTFGLVLHAVGNIPVSTNHFRSRTQDFDMNGDATSISIPLPPGTQDGDLLVAWFFTAVFAAFGPPQTPTPPTGFTAFANETTLSNNGQTTYRWVAYYKVASSEPASLTWSVTAGHWLGGFVTAYRDMNVSTPYDTHALTYFGGPSGYGMATTVDAPSITTALSNELLIAIHINDVEMERWSVPTGMTQRADWWGIAWNDEIIAAAGATGVRTATYGIVGTTGHTLSASFLTNESVAGYTLVADPGTLALTGTAATLTYDGITHSSLVADPGTVVLAGTAATLAYGRNLDAAASSITLTGTAAALTHARRVVAEAGALALTGTDATLTYDGITHYTFVADPATVALAGVAATLTYDAVTHYSLVAAPGSVVLTGTAASLRGADFVLAPTYRLFTVPTDDRTFVVALESRTFVVED